MERRDSFGYWMRRRRKTLDLTQNELAQQVGCAVGTIQKLEGDERRPSKQLAARLADLLLIPSAERDIFLKVARAELSSDQLEIDDRPSEILPLRPLDRSVTNLPAPATPFIGRERERTALRHLLGRDDVRLVTLSGPGGTGKTRLGLQVAADILDRFEHGAWFVNLAPIGDLTMVAPMIAQALDVREIDGQPILELVKRFLREKRTLLLLDNFEHVVEAAPLISELLSFAAGLKILVTSRTTLRLSGEHEYSVPPLGLPPTTYAGLGQDNADGRPTIGGQRPNLQTITQYEAVRLFTERAQAVKADFMVTEENALAVAEICYRLDGLPLAIELAAARVKLFPPQALLERLGSPLKFLTGGARDLPTRQQTIHNTIQWSYQLLDEREKILFARLGAFVGGCTMEAAEGICNSDDTLRLDVVDGIAALVDQSLLRQDEGPGGTPRFVMLETIREYALERLEQRGEVEAVRQWHAKYFLMLAEEAEPELAGPRQVAWLARLDRDLDNLRAALGWSIEHHEIETALRLAGALTWFWFTRSYWNEGRRWFETTLARSAGAARASRAKALLGSGQLATFQNDHDHAYMRCEQAHALYLELDDRRGAAWALFFLSVAAQDQSDLTRSNAAAAESLALRRSIGDRRGIAYSLHAEGEAALYAGEFARAMKLCDEGLALFRAIGDTYGISLSLLITAEAAYATGDYDRAKQLCQECLHVNHELGDRRGRGMTLEILGRVTRAQGEDLVARSLYAQALSLLSDAGDRWSVARCIESIAVMYVESDTWRAARLFGAAETLRQSIGLPQTYLDRSRCEQAVAAARARLGATGFEAVWAGGGELTLTQAIEEALNATAEPPSAGLSHTATAAH
jgi:predicted ATPase/transcriptional regulator with XRE-family HTH domain